MNVVDERGSGEHIVFCELCIGDCFINEDGDLCIKTEQDSGIYTTNNRNWYSVRCDADDKVIPLEATLTIRKRN